MERPGMEMQPKALSVSLFKTCLVFPACLSSSSLLSGGIVPLFWHSSLITWAFQSCHQGMARQSGLFSFCNWITESKYKISTVTTSDFLRGGRKHQWNHSTFLCLPAAQPTDWVLSVRCTREANTKWKKYIYWIHFLIIAFLNHGVLLPEILKGTVVLTFLCCFPVGCLSSQSRHHT